MRGTCDIVLGGKVSAVCELHEIPTHARMTIARATCALMNSSCYMWHYPALAWQRRWDTLKYVLYVSAKCLAWRKRETVARVYANFMRVLFIACSARCTQTFPPWVAHICIFIRVLRPAQDRIHFSRFSKWLKRLCSMPLLYTATMVETPRISFFYGISVTGLPQSQSSVQPAVILAPLAAL